MAIAVSYAMTQTRKTILVPQIRRCRRGELFQVRLYRPGDPRHRPHQTITSETDVI